MMLLSNIPIQPLANIMTITHSGTLGIFGIKITEYKITGKYEYNSSGATSHLSTRGVVVRNFNPTVVTDCTYYSGYISGGTYYGETAFSYKVGIAGYGVQIGNVYLEVAGNQKGKIYGRFYRD
jgi:hypothetical protein